MPSATGLVASAALVLASWSLCRPQWGSFEVPVQASEPAAFSCDCRCPVVEQAAPAFCASRCSWGSSFGLVALGAVLGALAACCARGWFTCRVSPVLQLESVRPALETRPLSIEDVSETSVRPKRKVIRPSQRGLDGGR